MNKFVLRTLLMVCLVFISISIQAESVDGGRTQVHVGGLITLHFSNLIIGDIYTIYAENVINKYFTSIRSTINLIVYIPIHLNVTLLLFELSNNNIVVDTYLITIINEGSFTALSDIMVQLFPYYIVLCFSGLVMIYVFGGFISDKQKEPEKKAKEMLVCDNCLNEYNQSDIYCYDCGNKL